MRRCRPWRATKVELLEFMYLKEITFIYQLTEWFGFTYGSACRRLQLLKKQNLAISDGKGHWVLTEEGIRRLHWLKRKSQRK